MREIYDENEVLRDALSGLNEEVPPMPEGLHAAWMQKVEEDAVTKTKQPTRTRFMQKATRYLSIAAALVFVVGGTLLTRDQFSDLSDIRTRQPALGSAATYSGASFTGARKMVYEDGGVEETAAADYDLMVASNAELVVAAATSGEWEAALSRAMPEPAEAEKKIIRTASLTIATQTYEDSLAALRSGCEQSGGWIQNVSESVGRSNGLRTAHLTLRIPQSALDGYLLDADALGRITSRSESATDVTESYQDTAARLSTQEALMARLQALLPESADLTDLLALESQIADTQYEIDRLRSSLTSTDRQVTYSTVTVTLKEETSPALTDGAVSFSDRLKAAVFTGWEAFTSFLSDAAVFLMAALPFIAVVAVLYIAVRIVRRFKRRNP